MILSVAAVKPAILSLRAMKVPGCPPTVKARALLAGNTMLIRIAWIAWIAASVSAVAAPLELFSTTFVTVEGASIVSPKV